MTVNPDTRRYIHPSPRRVTEANRIWLGDSYGKTLYLRPADGAGSEG
ncbi:hypothetical protein [Streptomyces sp. NPDC046862]